ncbi:Taurine catabolism dioxygenase TauD, TfdA family [Bradyrhizobium sp. NFR13]|nr:Taurine catabolism dioxygenase TauD, TfdA family [Bradyrhizobium sp. NFR13]
MAQAHSGRESEEHLRKTISDDGYIFLKQWHPEQPTQEIVSRLGRPLTFGKASSFHRIAPTASAPPNTYSGMYGLDSFPLHSDMAHWRKPPRYLFLRCFKGSRDVHTIVADGNEIVSRAMLTSMLTALVRPRRPQQGSLPLLPLYRPPRLDQPSMLRWDEKFIVPASRSGASAMRAIRIVLPIIQKTTVALADRGDTLVIDNWRMLHGRSVVPEAHVDRIIDRAYLEELH